MAKDNIVELLNLLEFEREDNIFSKQYSTGAELKVDISGNGYISYKECGITIGRETTCSLLEPESLVVLTCVNHLLLKEYRPEHLELEPAWKLGHSSKGGYADIWIRTFQDGNLDLQTAEKQSLCIIECKKWDKYEAAWTDTIEDGAQLYKGRVEWSPLV